MNTSLCHRFIRFCTSLVIAVNLAACADEPKVVKHHKYIKPSKIKQEDGSRNVKPVDGQEQEDLETKDTSQDSDAGAIADMPQALLILEYKNEGERDMRQSYILIPAAIDNNEFPGLLELLNQLSENKAVLHNMHIADMSSKNSGAAIPPADKSSANNNKRLPAEDEIDVGLHLIRFFIDTRQRDAAYIMVDNTKKTLASLSGPGAREKGKHLLSELESLEVDMRRVMPFTL